MRRFALLALLIAMPAQADPTLRALLPAEGMSNANLIETATGEMLVLVVDGPRAGLYRAQDGALKERLTAPDNLEAVWPAGSGFIGTRTEERPHFRSARAFIERRQVVSFTGDTAESRLLYETPQRVAELRVEPAPGAEAFYVLEPVEPRFKVLRFAGSGELEWEFDLGATRYADILGVPGGVLLRRQVAAGSWSTALLDEAGVLAWRTNQPVARRHAAFMAPTRAALPLELAAPGTHTAIIDVRDGKELSRLSVLTGSTLHGTRDGLLLTEVSMGQPYAARFLADGTRIWSRRLPIDYRPSILLDTAITARGELWMLAKPYGSAADGTNALVLLRTSAANPGRPGPCLDVDPDAVAALSLDLMTRHGTLTLLGAGSSSGPAPCPLASDMQRLEFLRQLAAVLGEKATLGAASAGRPRVLLRIDAKARPYERLAYNDDNGGRLCEPGRCPPPAVTYAASSGAGREVGNFLRQQLLPHLDRLEQLRVEFKALTGEEFVARDGFVMSAGKLELLEDAALFATLEKNAATLLREIKALPAEALSEYRSDAERSLRHLVLTPDAFGDQFTLQPITEIVATLRRLYLFEYRQKPR